MKNTSSKLKKSLLFVCILIIIFLIYLFFVNFENNLFNLYENKINYYSSQGNYKKVEKLYFQEISIQKRFFDKDKIQLKNTLNKLIDFYITQKAYDNAFLIYKKYWNLIPIKLISVNYDLNLSEDYSRLGTLFLKKKEYKKSEEFYKKALTIKESIKNKPNENWSASALRIDKELNNLANLMIGQKKYEDALVYLNQAIETIKDSKEYKGDESLFFEVYKTFYLYYLSQNKYDAAEEYIQKIYKIIPYMSYSILNDPVKQLGIQHSETNKLLAKIYVYKNDYKKSMFLLNESLALDTKIFGKNSPEAICDYYNILEIQKENHLDILPQTPNIITIKTSIFEGETFFNDIISEKDKPYFLGMRINNIEPYTEKVKLFCTL